MPEEKTEEITQPSPFDEGAWKTSPPTKEEPIVEEKTTPTESADPVIEEKDKKIEEEKPTSDKPNDPLEIPKATPPPVQDLPKEEKKAEASGKFDIAEWVKEKEDELYSSLSQRQVIKNVEKLSPSEVLKLQIKNENKEYTDTEVEDIFNERFNIPEKPERLITDTDDEWEAEEEKYKEQLARYNRRIERESKTAKASLLKSIPELVLPDIPQQVPQPQEPTQEELAQFAKRQEQFLQAVEGSLTELKGYNATFKDKEVEIPIAYNIADKEKEELKPLLDSLNTDLPQFFRQLNWIDKDDNLNYNKVVSDLHIINNKDSVIQKFVNEAGNKRLEKAIKAQKNVDFTDQTRRGNLEPSVQEVVDKKVNAFLLA